MEECNPDISDDIVAAYRGEHVVLAIVTFDHGVDLALPLTLMDGVGSKLALDTIERIHVGGQTNLSGGMLRAIDELQRSYGDDGRFVVRYYLSRETPNANGVAGGLDGAVCERLQQGGLEAAFAEWRTIARDCAFLVVGTREMCRQTYGILESLGFGRRLCGFRGAKDVFLEAFYILKNDDRFTTTGSGQT